MSKPLLVTFVVLCWLAQPNASPADTKLQYQHNPNEVQKLKVTTKAAYSTALGDQRNETKTTIVTNFEVACDSVDSSGVAKLRKTFKRTRVSIEMPGNMKSEFDTNEPAPKDAVLTQYEAIYRPLISQVASMQCDQRGRISDLRIPEKILERTKSKEANSAATEDWLQYLIDASRVSLPEKPLMKGGTWMSESVVKSQAGTMTTNYENKYLGPDEKSGHEKIEYRTAVKFEPSEDPKNRVKMILKWSDGHGEILFDNQRGRLIRNHSQTALEYELDLGGQKTSMITDQTVTIELDDSK